MIIDITERPASHCWVVCMDALQVNFYTLGEAQAFVGQLKARIEAPHVWPSVTCRADGTRPMPDRQTAYSNGKRVCIDRVE
ncbi:hypothetical protein [Pseudomonas azerbaijanorientalis]|jgi:hypothetical protein|uniref:hypothetical protein n=1 Tax=Pseudomonas azerbaijanorientalis TaxID=2842350 RepID=UPI000F96D523|nr:hypothetical protein [Pseudomonas azerbaijanorientalis]QXH64212.1 hypothetical protein KSS91_12335 [Pseudomonas azerbaijanorientalis]